MAGLPVSSAHLRFAPMESSEELIRRIFTACAELSESLGRPVSPDGHLVGSLGEIFARDQLGLTLMPPSNEGFDARTLEGAPVEIKATTRNSIALSSAGSRAEILVVVKIDQMGRCTIVFNGPIERAWAVAGKPQRNGQRRVSISKLLQSPSSR